MRAIIVHGNGNSTPGDNWIPYLKSELEKLGLEVLTPQFPDPPLARAAYWLPFLQNKCKVDENTILIGHSTGAIATMRFAETHKLLGSVLVGTYYTDRGSENEKLSGYFDTPWDWDAIRKNQQWIIQFAGANDPWIPIEEARMVRDCLRTEYHEYPHMGHFGGDYHKPTFPELLIALRHRIKT